MKRARTWEFQALCKLNFIHGNKILFNKLTKIINDSIKNQDAEKIKKDMKEMRQKLYPSDFSSLVKIFNIKKSRGGLLDIDFIIQFMMLSNFHLFKTCRGKGILNTIEKIVSTQDVANDFNILKKNFIFLKNLELYNQVIFGNTTSSLTFNESNLKVFAKKMGLKNQDSFKSYLNEVSKENYSLFLKYLGIS